MVQLLDGKAVSNVVLEQAKAKVQGLAVQPHLHVITVGEDTGSQVFVKQKRLAAEKVGLRFSQSKLPEETSLSELKRVVLSCNRDSEVHGLIVQLPLPPALHSHERTVLDLVSPEKDVDCFHPRNFGQLALDDPVFLPATPAGILRIIQHYGIETKGKRCVIMGKSNIVGKPLGLLMSRETGAACTVVLCDRFTENVWDLTRQADILVVAAGKHHLLNDPKALRADGQAVVIDVGIHRVQNAEGKTIVQGDVNFEAISPHCKWITPVPGGVGPMTVACLVEQVVEAASLQQPASEIVERVLRSGSNSRLRPSQILSMMTAIDAKFDAATFDAALKTLPLDSSGHISLDDFLGWTFGNGLR